LSQRPYYEAIEAIEDAPY